MLISLTSSSAIFSGVQKASELPALATYNFIIYYPEIRMTFQRDLAWENLDLVYRSSIASQLARYALRLQDL